MIADDEQIMRKLLRTILSMKYNIVGAAKDGEEALEMYKENRPDLVILDVKMPNMDGFETLEKIKEIDESQRVILCTGVDDHDKIREAVSGGANAYIVKPYKKKRLLDTVEKVLNPE